MTSIKQEIGRVKKTKGLPLDKIRDRLRLISNKFPNTRPMVSGGIGKSKRFIKYPRMPKAITSTSANFYTQREKQ
ncbi:MAG: hypothetical protein WC159_01015, partial [Sphaerochaetaceae bacterium]